VELAAETWKPADCEHAIRFLQKSTLQLASLAADRDLEISKIAIKHAPAIDRESEKIALLERQIEAYYRKTLSGNSTGKTVSCRMGGCTIGMRYATNPALVPIDDKWTWERVTETVMKFYRRRFLLRQLPCLDKVKLKRSLKPDQLRKIGLKLDDTGKFFLDLDLPMTEAA